MFPGWLESVFFAKLVEKGIRHFLVYAHRPVSLNVTVTTDRAESGTGLAEISQHELKVYDLLDCGDRIFVLGKAHRPAKDG